MAQQLLGLFFFQFGYLPSNFAKGGMMTAPCIQRLDRDISEADTDYQKARLLAEKAWYLARIGNLDEAERIRLSLREEFGSGRDLGVSVRIMILEAILSYFRDFGVVSGDRLLRARLLSVAAGDKDLIAITCAWLSHIQYYEGKYSDAVNSAQTALINMRTDDWAVCVRVGLLFGDMFLLVGNSVSSRSWYELARTSAVSYGDQAAVGALIYNRASLRVFNLRIAGAMGESFSEQDIKFADAECRSAINYQNAANVKSLAHLLTAAEVGIKMLRQDYLGAKALLLPIFSSDQLPLSYPYRQVLLAELILCHAALGDVAAAAQKIQEIKSEDISQLPVDDALLAFSIMNEVFLKAPSTREYFSGVYDLDELKAAYSAQRHEISEILRPFVDLPQTFRSQK